MKMIKTFAVALAMLATVPVMAQFGGGASTGSAGDNANYQRVYLGYNAVFASPKGGKSGTLNGFAAGYNYGLNLTESLPLYLEFGGRLSYNAGENKTSLMSISIPVSVAYRFNINDNIAITPYTGINFRINVIGKKNGVSMFGGSDSNDGSDFWDSEDWDWGEYSSRGWEEEFEEAMDNLEDSSKWKRFQMGWQIGAGVNYGPWYAGLEYGIDFIELQKNLSTSNFSFTVGYTF